MMMAARRIITEFTKMAPKDPANALRLLVAASDRAFYDGELLPNASKLCSTPTPLYVGFKKLNSKISGKLYTCFSGKNPKLFILTINSSMPKIPKFGLNIDNENVSNYSEYAFWTVQHELLHLFERVKLGGKSGSKKKHCSNILHSAAKTIYGNNYEWNKC